MALPGSGAISLGDIQTEFGGSNPISISEYYAAAPGVPGSGTISFSDFHGKSAGWTITEGNDGIYKTGYSSGAYGSISGATTFGGANVTMISQHRADVKGSWVYIFAVRMSGDRAANFWTSVIIDGYGTINSSSMARSYIGPDTEWSVTGVNVTGIDGSGTTTGRFT